MKDKGLEQKMRSQQLFFDFQPVSNFSLLNVLHAAFDLVVACSGVRLALWLFLVLFIFSHIVFVIVVLVIFCSVFPVLYVLTHVRLSVLSRDFHEIF